jgi:hypothetical protein
MTDIKLLTLLGDYYAEQRTVVYAILWAMEEFERGRMDSSWAYLFEWCENKDRRDELFGKFKNNHARAVMLKEGYEV